MDATAIRWISLGVVAALAALAAWAVADATKPAAASADPASPAPTPTLDVHRPGQPSQRVRFEDGAVLGRSRDCLIVFDDATVSKEHARLRRDGHAIVIEDLHSTNGTLVNGRAIDGPTPLHKGDRIALGPNVIVFAGEI